MFDVIITLISWVAIIGVVSMIRRQSKKQEEKANNKRENTQNRRNPSRQSQSTQQRRNVNQQRRSEQTKQEGSRRKSFLDRVREEYEQALNQESDSSAGSNYDPQAETPKPLQSSRTDSERNTQQSSQKRERRRQRKSAVAKSRYRDQQIQDFSSDNSMETVSLKDPYTAEEKPAAVPSLNRKKLREAIVTKEILDKPKALRKQNR